MNQVGGPVVCTTGMTAAQRQRIIRGWRNDEFIRLAPGYYMDSEVYADATRDDQITARVVAHACAAPSSVVVGRSAARLWGFPVSTSNETLREEKIELGSRQARTRGRRRVRYRKLGAVHEGTIVGRDTEFGTVKVTDPVTTALDLARWGDLDDAVRALDHGLQHELFTWEEMAARLQQLQGTPGVGQAQTAGMLASTGSESPRETDVKLLLWRLGCGAPWQQVDITSRRGVWIGRVDFFFPELGLIIEYDGAAKYGDPDSGVATKAKEYDQHREYRLNGLVPIHITDETLRNGTAQELIEGHLAALAILGCPYPDHLWSGECPAWSC